MLKKIFIYAGPGALKDGIKHLLLTLQNTVKNSYAIKMIGPRELLDSNWEKEASLFILPGGADLPYVKKLNGAGNKKIKSFVEDGGSFLGICAGSYYAGNYVEFAKGSELEVTGTRELGFFPGIVKGPINKEFFYCSHKGSEAASLIWKNNSLLLSNKIFKVYYNGGGYFVNAENEKLTTVLATYDSIEKLPALIECQVGKGKAILSGAHFEYDYSLLDPQDPFLADIIPSLKHHQSNRLLLASHIFERLGLYF